MIGAGRVNVSFVNLDGSSDPVVPPADIDAELKSVDTAGEA